MSGRRVELDHVVLAVTDIDQACERIWREFGLRSVDELITFPGSGTGSKVVPLGPHYLELLSVVEPDAEDPFRFTAWVAANASEHGTPLMWALRATDLEAESARLSSPVFPQTGLINGSGRELSWGVVGMGEIFMAGDRARPFFINADNPFSDRYRSLTTEVGHRSNPLGVVAVEVSGDAQAIGAVIDDPAVPVRVTDGASALNAYVIATEAGELRIT